MGRRRLQIRFDLRKKIFYPGRQDFSFTVGKQHCSLRLGLCACELGARLTDLLVLAGQILLELLQLSPQLLNLGMQAPVFFLQLGEQFAGTSGLLPQNLQHALNVARITLYKRCFGGLVFHCQYSRCRHVWMPSAHSSTQRQTASPPTPQSGEQRRRSPHRSGSSPATSIPTRTRSSSCPH